MRNIVITGGTRGIGAECTRLFTKNGDRVFAIYCRDEQSAELISRETGAIAVKADISDPKDVERAVRKIHDFGKIDVLVNNAGIAQIKMFCDITEDDWDRMMDVNIKGAFLMTQAVLPDMIHKKQGKIVNVSSMWGQTGGSCEVHYSASKAAVIGFTKALAKELAPSGICVNCVSPGVIATDMNSSLSAEDMRELCEEIPLGKIGSVQDVANCIFFLADENSAYVTGQVLAVNGGIVI